MMKVWESFPTSERVNSVWQTFPINVYLSDNEMKVLKEEIDRFRRWNGLEETTY